MKIDVFNVWLLLFVIGACFQSFFTVCRSEFDVSYSYTNDSMDYIAYGQTQFSLAGRNIDWETIKMWLEEVVTDENKEPVTVVVLGVYKRDSYRLIKPFWKS